MISANNHTLGKNVQNVPLEDPYKDWEFEKFLKMISAGNITRWYLIARALNVSEKTLRRWRTHPRAQKAVVEAIEGAWDGMEKAGRNDWRMYQAKLAMLGVIPEDKYKVIEILVKPVESEFSLEEIKELAKKYAET